MNGDFWPPDDAIAPLLYSEHKHAFTHRERVDAFWQRAVKSTTADVTPVQATRIRDGSAAQTTVNVGPLLNVSELVYPGSRLVRPERKWIYVFHPKKTCVLEAYVGLKVDAALYRPHPSPPPTVWKGDAPKAGQNGFIPTTFSAKDAVCLPIPRKPGESPVDFLVFISPWRLNQKALNKLTGDSGLMDQCCIPARAGLGPNLTVACIDPYAWAMDTNSKFYQPLLKAHNGWVNDEYRSAELFIASTLDSFVGPKQKIDPSERQYFNGSYITPNVDSYDIINYLKGGEPRTWLDYYKREELKRRTSVEAAAAYLCKTALDRPEFKFVEHATLDQEGMGIGLTGAVYAIACCALTHSRPGQLYARRLIGDLDRYVAQQVFTDERAPVVSWDHFPSFRYLWYANYSTFLELHPAWVYSKLKAGVANADVASRLEKYAEHLGGEFEETLEHWHVVTKGLSDKKKVEVQMLKVDKTFRRKLRKGDIEFALTEGEEIFPEAVVGFKKYSKSLHFLHVWANIGLEICNFSMAYMALRRERAKADSTETTGKFITVVGASADFGTMLATVAKRAEMLGGRIGQWLPVLGVISGMCDMFDYGERWVNANDSGSLGEQVGCALGTAGAGLVAIGSAFAIAQYFSAAVWVGPWGLAFAVIGTAMLSIGALVVNEFKRSPYQQFANYCFLGAEGRSDHSGKAVIVPWAPEVLNSPDPRQQAKNLMELLHSWQVSMPNDGSRVEIRQAIPQAGNVFRVDILWGLSDKILPCRLVVEPDKKRIRDFTSEEGDRIGVDLTRVSWEYDPDGQFRAVQIQLNPNLVVVNQRRFTGGTNMRRESVSVGATLQIGRHGQRFGSPDTTFWLVNDFAPFHSDDFSLTSLDRDKTDAPQGVESLEEPAAAWG